MLDKIIMTTALIGMLITVGGGAVAILFKLEYLFNVVICLGVASVLTLVSLVMYSIWKD